MKAIIIHTDFRIYWPARIYALQQLLNEKEIELHILEIAGEGGHYNFAQKKNNYIANWHILFPSSKIETLNTKNIKTAMYEYLNQLQPDVIIAGAIAFPSGAIATSWAKKKKKKIIIFDDAKVEDVKRSNFVNYVKQHIYNCVDAMIYPSEDWNETGTFWKFKKEQLFYGVDVVDNDFWQQHTDVKNEIKNNYFISIGRQIPKKNFIFLLEAYHQYRTKIKEHPYDLILIGEGPERKNIEEYINEKEINGVLLLPFIQQVELLPLYRYADAFILASKKDETWGLVINEAMASGLPVIVSSKCGAAKTLVRDGLNGYVFSPNDMMELSEKLITFHLLSDDEKQMMKEQSLSIINEWGIDRFSKSTYEAIKYVLKRKNKKTTLIDSMILYFWKGRYRSI